jgi:5'-3' exoribonuclease 1
MGIPSYFSFIVKNHASIIKKYDGLKKVNHLYLDCNSIIYDAVNNVNWKEENSTKTSILLKWVINKIEEYIMTIKPKDTIFIAFDGVAPVAKLEQQRGRRYKSWYQNNILQDIGISKKEDAWNTSAITPGTEFMNELNDTIKKHFIKVPNTSTNTFGEVHNIIVSGSDVEGEGEHKMFEYIRAHADDHKDSTTIIYGLDADLIMLSINHLPVCPNIFLFRETPHFIQSIDSTLEPNQTYLLDIPELTRIITLNMNNGVEMTTQQQRNRIYDYILICFMLGNDFLPHFPAVNIRTGGIDKLLNAYKATIGGTANNLSDGTQIFWNNFRKFVEFLAKQEEEFIKTEMKLRDKRERIPFHVQRSTQDNNNNNNNNNTPEEKFKKFEALPTYKRDTEKFINPFKMYWRERYYKALFKIDINDERRRQISVNYLEGLEWTMKYYTTNCPDWRWCYKYNYPPLLEDLYKNIPSFETTFLQNKERNPVTPLVQLCYVLPKSSLGLLPDNLSREIVSKYSHLYNDDCDFVWSYCKYFWESHVELPEMDIAELERIITNNKIKI